MDDIELKIEEIISTASLLIWDMLGHHGDRLILPDMVSTIDDLEDLSEMQLDTIPDIVNLIDELIIANFASYFLPYTEDI